MPPLFYTSEKMKKQTLKDNNGFTLIELLVTMSIIAILSTVAVTSYVGVTLKAARSEAYSNLQNLRLLEEQFYAENACYQNLVGGVCPAATTIFTGTAAIQAFLPGFQPGTAVNFTYALNIGLVALPAPPVAVPYNSVTVANGTNCFIATATGIAGTRVAGDVFTIDCNNNRNF